MENNSIRFFKKSEAKPKVGRPELWEDRFVEVAFELALVGYSDQQIARVLGVSKSQVNNWKKEHPEFLASLKRGKALADSKVALGLYKRATGYEYDAVKPMVVDKELILVPLKVHVPPDPGAAMSWLKNRQPEVWREKQTIEHTVDMVVTMDLSGGEKGGPIEDVDYEEDTDEE